MTLQTSGAISLQQVNVELGKTSTATISLNDAAVRKLLGKASGTISMQDAYGKSNTTYVNTVARTSVSIYELMGSPTAVANYIFENNAQIYANTTAYALRTGVFPVGSTLTIINRSYICGRGGEGSSSPIVPGGAGGDVIYLDMDCRIDNSSGYIFAGGGGGGSARLGSGDSHITGGGGGGAGSSVGAAGANSYAIYVPTTNTAPQAGTATAGGAGGNIRVDSGNYYKAATGGVGGANGAIGAVGVSGTNDPGKPIAMPGAAGAAGRAIITNGKTLTQVAGFDSTRVKGAIV